MTSIRTLVPAALCAAALFAAVPASAEPFHGGGRAGFEHRGWDHRDHHWGVGRTLAVGGLGLAAGALVTSSYHPDVAGPACSRTVSTHYNASGQLVKVVQDNPC